MPIDEIGEKLNLKKELKATKIVIKRMEAKIKRNINWRI
jgi:hypothetical protein